MIEWFKDIVSALPVLLFCILVVGKVFNLALISWWAVFLLPLSVYLFCFVMLVLFYLFVTFLIVIAHKL
jgi:hypothetical protein